MQCTDSTPISDFTAAQTSCYDALVVFLTAYSAVCSACTPIERRAYNDHCQHSRRRWQEQQAAREALREYAARYCVWIDLRGCTEAA